MSEKDQAKIPDFRPTVYSFNSADFQRTPSNEFISRKPIKAIGVEQLTMPAVLTTTTPLINTSRNVSYTGISFRHGLFSLHRPSGFGQGAGSVGMPRQVVIENPIINSPFSEPTRHFLFDQQAIRTAGKEQ